MSGRRRAVIECFEEIPCNPCEAACPFGAIRIGECITSLPQLDAEKCTGCGRCIAACPGLAIFVVDPEYGASEASVDFPYEYVPLPAEGSIVAAVDRFGKEVCKGRILAVRKLPSYQGTTVVSMAVAGTVCGYGKKYETAWAEGVGIMTYGDSDIIICRCQELTKADILAAIRDGAETVNGVKKRTKACMGFCQGKTCEKLIERIVAEATGKDPAVLVPPTSRAPVRPVDIRVFLDTEDEQT